MVLLMFCIDFKKYGICVLLGIPSHTLVTLVVEIGPPCEPWRIQGKPQGSMRRPRWPQRAPEGPRSVAQDRLRPSKNVGFV